MNQKENVSEMNVNRMMKLRCASILKLSGWMWGGEIRKYHEIF